MAHGAWENDVVALRGMREIFDYLPLNNKDKPEPRPTHDSRHRQEQSLRYVCWWCVYVLFALHDNCVLDVL